MKIFKLQLIVLSLFGSSVLAATNTTSNTSDSVSASASASASGLTSKTMNSEPSKPSPIVHKPDNYKPDNLAASVREETCDNQQLFCDNVCGIEGSKSEINDCNVNTFSWICMCQNGIQPNTTAYTFPVEFVACTENLRSCMEKCGSSSDCNRACEVSKNCTAADSGSKTNSTATYSRPTFTRTALDSSSVRNLYTGTTLLLILTSLTLSSI